MKKYENNFNGHFMHSINHHLRMVFKAPCWLWKRYEKKAGPPHVMEKSPTTKYPTMNTSTDTDHIQSAWKHKTEYIMLREKALLNLNEWCGIIGQTGKKHQREGQREENPWKTSGLWTPLCSPTHSSMLTILVLHHLIKPIPSTRKEELPLPELASWQAGF